MKTVGDTLEAFTVMTARPGFLLPEENGHSAYETITQASFPDHWKVIYFYPRDFDPACADQIAGFARLQPAFAERGAVLLGGSADNECVKLAWRRENAALERLNHHAFGDVKGELIDQLGVRDRDTGAALLATFIVDADNTIQHVSAGRLEAGCRPQEILRVLTALQDAAQAAR
ncbi:redoxin domain-containing protein [Burkholderia sp. 22PA0106]|uniref:redoxin domain-containing protein n=1 Tax=Burkholderia sp. 22PA0106 TaxID=3237371 RepID=UPI0039C054CF